MEERKDCSVLRSAVPPPSAMSIVIHVILSCAGQQMGTQIVSSKSWSTRLDGQGVGLGLTRP